MKVLVFDGRDKIYEDEIKEAVMPGMDGEFSVLDFHQPLVYRLRKGLVKLRFRQGGTDGESIKIKDGLAKFEGNTLLVLCEKTG